MTEDAVRWQTPEENLSHSAASPSAKLRFDGEPGQPASAKEMNRQANALGRFVTDPRNACHFRLVAAGRKIAERCRPGAARAGGIGTRRRAAPRPMAAWFSTWSPKSRRACTVLLRGDLFEMNGGCTVVLDPQGEVRYAISKCSGEARQARQHVAIGGPLRTSGGNQAAASRKSPTSCNACTLRINASLTITSSPGRAGNLPRPLRRLARGRPCLRRDGGCRRLRFRA